MSDSDTSIKTDPVYRTGWNDALDWAANWITNSLGAVYGYGDETVQFTLALAMSIRAAKMSIEQQDFFDAIRNDPYMDPERKAYWLAVEPKAREKR